MIIKKSLLRTSLKNLKKNYLLFVFICLFLAVFKIDFEGTVGGITGKYSDFTISFENADTSNDSNVFSNEEVFAKKDGVFAGAVNFLSNDNIVDVMFSAVMNISNNVVFSIFIGIIVSVIVLILTSYLLIAPIYVSINRLVLENRTYVKTKAERLFFLIRNKKWINVAKVILVRDLYLVCWAFTIVGVVIKHYSYYMVPYILAENPEMSAKEAITLSRKMMDGHKFDCFLRETAFYLTQIFRVFPALSIFSFLMDRPVFSVYAFIFSMSYIVLFNPLKLTYFAEYYVLIRELSLENEVEFELKDKKYTAKELLNDRYLYEIADQSVLQREYQDIEENKILLDKPALPHPGIGGFFANNLSLVFVQNEASRDYEMRKSAEYKLAVMGDDHDGISYPDRLHPAFKKNGFPFVDKMHFDRQYTLTNVLLMFLIASFFGWLWEVSLHLVQAGKFVNRGTLYGPWLPIYGSGGILVLLLLTRLRKYPVTTFFTTIILCGILEFTTSVMLELKHGVRWWDYSGYFMNIDGRICGEGLLIFGIGGMVFIYICAPLLDNLLNKHSRRVMRSIAVVLSIIFIADFAYSSKNPNAGEGVVENPVNTEQSVDTE